MFCINAYISFQSDSPQSRYWNPRKKITWSEYWPRLGQVGVLSGIQSPWRWFSMGSESELWWALGRYTQIPSRGTYCPRNGDAINRWPPAHSSFWDCLSCRATPHPRLYLSLEPTPNDWLWSRDNGSAHPATMGTTLKTTPIPLLLVGSTEATVGVRFQGLSPLVSSTEAEKSLRINLTISFKGSFSRARIRHRQLSVDVAPVREENTLRTSCLG